MMSLQEMIRKECLKLTDYSTHNPSDFIRFTQRLDDGPLELIRKTNCFAMVHVNADEDSKQDKQCEKIKANIITLLMEEINRRPLVRPRDPIELSAFRTKMAVDASALFQIAAYRVLDLNDAVRIDPSFKSIADESVEVAKKVKRMAESTAACVENAKRKNNPL